MDIIFFYLFACVPVGVGLVLWIKSREVVWQEWVAGSVLGFIMAGIFHLIAAFGQTSDLETWSGHIIKATHHPRWVEEYQQMHTRIVGSGNNTSTEVYFTTEYRTHGEYWDADTNINSNFRISQDFYNTIADGFGNKGQEVGYKPGFHGGDRNIYPTINFNSHEKYPVTKLVSFENKVRATPTTFSYAKVPKHIDVYPYPANANPLASNRLLGTAQEVDLLMFDRLNARIGPWKQANLILVGFGDRDSSAAHWQESAWVGGKKNDVVLCWGGPNGKPSWTRAFGWTDSKTLLRNLETIALANGVSTETLPLLEREIERSYKLKDWHGAFAHIKVPAPSWAVVTYFMVATIAQLAFWYLAHANEYRKSSSYHRTQGWKKTGETTK